MNHCPNYSVVIIKSEPGKKTIARARCKSWKCEYCAELNKFQWQTIMRYALNKTDGTWQFVTFTAHQNWRGEASYTNIRKNGDKLWKRWRRLAAKHTTEKMHYIRILEPHKDESLHVHAFIFAPMDIYPDKVKRNYKNHTRSESNGTRWLKDNAKECGLGYQGDVKELSDKQKGINYVVKYMSKSVFGDAIPAGARRIQTSQNFPKPEFMLRGGGDEWEVNRVGLTSYTVLSWIESGDIVYDADSRASLSRSDIDTSKFYYA